MGISLRLLDLFCGAGGASKGYASVFDDVVGIDIRRQPDYPYRFIQGDATTFPLDGFDLIHASPPCQDHSKTRFLFNEPDGTGWMLEHTIKRCSDQGLCYVIENVMGASMPAYPHDFTLCAASLGPWIQNPRKLFLGKHRKFWCNFPVDPPDCMCATAKQLGYTMGTMHTNRNGHYTRRDEFTRLMETDWMPNKAMQQALPPYYTKFIAREFLRFKQWDYLYR